MQTAPHPRPVRFILELAPDQLPALLTQVITQFATRATSAPPRPPPDPDDEEDDDEPAPPRPPPGAHAPPMPVLPAHVRRSRVLGRPCRKNHRYQNSAYCLRKKSNNGCVECERERARARQQAQASPTLAPVLGLPPVPALETRPALPAHLALTCFVSPIVCDNPEHRYRNQPPWTLRYVEDETCVMCVTQQSQRALAGD